MQVIIPKDKLLVKDHRYEFQVVYLFLQSIYYKLGLDRICKRIASNRKFDFDLSDILSRLVYGRILEPCSKRATYAFSKTLLEQPEFEEHQIYRALDVMSEESDYIQAELFKNSFAFGKRHTGIIYYDCTNFFFEIEEADEDGLRQYGKAKDGKPLPLVEMGLFIDQDGIPLGVAIHPRNTNEQVTLKPIEKRILQDYGLSRFVDRGEFEEKLIVTFSLKYRDYKRHIRESQIERAQRTIAGGKAGITKKNQNDFRRLIKRSDFTSDGEEAKKHVYALDEDAVRDEMRYDGFYAVCTDLGNDPDEDPKDIIMVNKNRWHIEECFRIMKKIIRKSKG